MFAFPMIVGNLFQQFYNMADSIIVGKFVSEDALASVGASYSIRTIFIMIAMGNAMSTFTAQNLGAKQIDRIEEGYKASFKMTLVFAIITLLILSLFYRPIVSIFLDASSSAKAYDVGINYVRFLGYFYLFIGLKSITDGVLRGDGDMRVFTLANLINLAIRVLSAYFFTQTIGIHSAWYGIPIGWFVNYVISYIYYKTDQWSEQVLI